MRELKFRAYIKPLKRYATWLDTIQFHKCCDVAGAGIWTVVTTNEGIFECDDIIVEQYTGLKDKNGKEIYEGDIVRCYSRKKSLGEYKVIWNEDCEGFECESLKPLVDGGGRILKDVRVFCEIATQFRVIGNIHENPELLEGEK